MADSNATKNALAESMKRLMRTKPFEKISVSDICVDCGINRKSFYYHFRDKYDLVNWIFYVGFIGGLDLTNYENGWDLVRDMCEYFYRERDFYKVALQIEGQNSFKDYLIETATPLAESFTRDIIPDEAEEQFFISFVTDGLLTSLVRWLTGGYGQEMDADEYLSKVLHCITGLAKNVGTAPFSDEKRSIWARSEAQSRPGQPRH